MSTTQSAFTTMGSGSLAAMSVFERGYTTDLSLEECKALACEAICAGILNDMGSGSRVNITVIKKDNEVIHYRPYYLPVPKQYAILFFMKRIFSLLPC